MGDRRTIVPGDVIMKKVDDPVQCRRCQIVADTLKCSPRVIVVHESRHLKYDNGYEYIEIMGLDTYTGNAVTQALEFDSKLSCWIVLRPSEEWKEVT